MFYLSFVLLVYRRPQTTKTVCSSHNFVSLCTSSESFCAYALASCRCQADFFVFLIALIIPSSYSALVTSSAEIACVIKLNGRKVFCLGQNVVLWGPTSSFILKDCVSYNSIERYLERCVFLEASKCCMFLVNTMCPFVLRENLHSKIFVCTSYNTTVSSRTVLPLAK